MKTREFQAIYVMWLRQMKRFIRSKSRLASSVIQPLFFLFILGSGFRSVEMPGLEGDYLYFLAPGIVAMAIMLTSMYTGISVLWDKQFGFMQEVLVAPVSRISIIIGRTIGGATTALIQGFIILAIIILMAVPLSGFTGLLLTLAFMIVIAFTSVGFGLIIASKMRDFQGFPLVMNLVIMPLIFLSSAFFPVKENPTLQNIAFFNPIFYMVDGLRGSLVGKSNVLPPVVNLLIVLVFCIITMFIGSYFFSKSEV